MLLFANSYYHQWVGNVTHPSATYYRNIISLLSIHRLSYMKYTELTTHLLTFNIFSVLTFREQWDNAVLLGCYLQYTMFSEMYVFI